MHAIAHACRPDETVFDALAAFYMERLGLGYEAAASPSGPVAALLAAARAQQHRPRPLLLGLLAGLAPASGAGPGSGRLAQEGAWPFLLSMLRCVARLHGATWPAFVKVRRPQRGGVRGRTAQCCDEAAAASPPRAVLGGSAP